MDSREPAGGSGADTSGTVIVVMDAKTLATYLDRIALGRPQFASAPALRELHLAHLRCVPFENLSIHLREPISLDEDALLEKLLERRRGGFCYELNGAFALLLEALGFRVARLAARVFGQNGLGPPFDHLALRVETADGTGPWLADVGFGSHSQFPLLLDARGEQVDPDGHFRLTDGEAADIDVIKNGKAEYRLEARPRSLNEFIPTCWWHQTSPASHFTRKTICSRLTETGRITISGRTLIRTRLSGERTEELLAGDASLLAAYEEYYGIRLGRVPDRVVG